MGQTAVGLSKSFAAQESGPDWVGSLLRVCLLAVLCKEGVFIFQYRFNSFLHFLFFNSQREKSYHHGYFIRTIINLRHHQGSIANSKSRMEQYVRDQLCRGPWRVNELESFPRFLLLLFNEVQNEQPSEMVNNKKRIRIHVSIYFVLSTYNGTSSPLDVQTNAISSSM